MPNLTRAIFSFGTDWRFLPRWRTKQSADRHSLTSTGVFLKSQIRTTQMTKEQEQQVKDLVALSNKLAQEATEIAQQAKAQQEVKK